MRHLLAALNLHALPASQKPCVQVTPLQLIDVAEARIKVCCLSANMLPQELTALHQVIACCAGD